MLGSKGAVRIYVPEIVIREFSSQHGGRLREAAQIAQKSLEGLMTLAPASLHTGLIEANRLIKESCVQVEADLNNRVQEWVRESNVIELPIQPTHGSRVVDDYFSGAPPFREPKHREDFPDAFVWQALKELVQEQSPIHFVSNDGGFEEGVNQLGGKIILHKDLQALLKSGSLPIVATEHDYRIAKILRAQLGALDAQVRTIIHSSLPGRSISMPVGIARDKDAGPFTIERILALRNLTLDADSVSALGNQTFLLQFSASAMLRAGYESQAGWQEGTFNVLKSARIRGDYDAQLTGSLIVQVAAAESVEEISAQIELDDLTLRECKLAMSVELTDSGPVEITAERPALERAIASARGILLIVGRSKKRKMRAASTLLSDLASAHPDSLFLATHGHVATTTVGTVRPINPKDFESYDDFRNRVVELRPDGMSLYIKNSGDFKAAEYFDTSEEMIVVGVTDAQTEGELGQELDHLWATPIIITAK
jgi:hypothetical protein